jgi:hypothetical protein
MTQDEMLTIVGSLWAAGWTAVQITRMVLAYRDKGRTVDATARAAAERKAARQRPAIETANGAGEQPAGEADGG